ncbi:MAG: sigma-70 family RNA polymerase sigma factor [Dehalococcoidia bacterium]|nr:sigma-70 family RNA polymerase sigma factor [Dehalococcoidia bacterium]
MTTTTTLSDFQEHRGALFGIAYRMLGSASEAEDIVQEAWLRWQSTDPTEVRSPRAYLTTVVTRLCLDHLKSARVQREQYIGTWLPEPVLTGGHTAPGPEDEVERLESVSLAFLVVLERLTPIERAVFLLHDVFDYGYPEIAGIVGRSEVACRQMLSRARKRIQAERPRFPGAQDEHRRIAGIFLRAIRGEDLPALVETLAEDCVLYTDGGGQIAATLKPIYGRDRVLRGWGGFSRKLEITRVELLEVNGEPAILFWDNEHAHSVFTFEVEGGKVTKMFVQRNPEKLATLWRELKAAESG